MERLRGSLVGALALVVTGALLLEAIAWGHVITGRRTLRSWTRDASVVAIVEIVTPVHTWRAADGSDHQDVVRLRILDTLRGTAPRGEALVTPHAEGMPDWRSGRRVLAFLEPTTSDRALAHLAPDVPWLTTQGAGDEWELETPEGEIERVARGWISTGPGASPAATEDLLLMQLRSSERRLREDAVLELVLARQQATKRGAEGAGLLSPKPFVDLAQGAGPLTLTERVALARAIDGAGDFSANALLRGLTPALPTLSARDRGALVRAAGQATDPDLSRWLAGLVEDEQADAVVRREAAAALGQPWHAAQAGALARASGSPDGVLARRAAQSLAAMRALPGTAASANATP